MPPIDDHSPEAVDIQLKLLDVQRQISDVLLKQVKSYEEVGHISRNVEATVLKFHQKERELLKEKEAAYKKIAEQYQKKIEARGTHEEKVAEFNIKSLQEEILLREREIALQRASARYEIEKARQMHQMGMQGELIGKILAGHLGIQNDLFSKTKLLSKEFEKYPINFRSASLFAAAIVVFLGSTLDIFKRLDTSAAEFRKSTGLIRDDAVQLRNVAEQMAIQFGNVGVTADIAYKSMLQLQKTMGSIYSLSSDLVKTTSLLSTQLGVSEESSAGFLHNLAAISKSTMQSQNDMAYIAADMARAAGIPLNQIMADVANRSKETLTMMSRIPTVVLRTSIEARRLNTTMSEMARAGRHILDFSESINAEMEASVLLGQSVNLQRARELAYRRDLEGSTKEILKITKQIGFENLDVFQQEAFARATGHSVDELLKMVQAERQWEAARRDPLLKDKVDAAERIRRANQDELKSRGKNLELMIQQRSNQDRITAIQNKWNQLMTKLSSVLLPIIDGFLSLAIPIMDVSMGLMGWSIALKPFASKLSSIFQFWKGVAIISSVLFPWFGKIVGVVSKIAGWFGSIVGYIGQAIPFAGKFFGFFGRVLGPIGLIITGLNFIYSLFSRLHGIGDAFKEGILKGIVFGLKAVLGALYDSLLKPFKDAWDWIADKFVGKSPSTLGLGIVKGILSIQGILFDAITQPWRKALAWIADKIPGMGKMIEKIKGDNQSVIKRPIEAQAANAYVPTVTVTPNYTVPNGAVVDKSKTSSKSEDETIFLTEATGQKILSVLQELLKKDNNLYVDGALLSSTLARNIEFRGHFGSNR